MFSAVQRNNGIFPKRTIGKSLQKCQTLEVDQNKCLYRIEKTDFAFIFHHFFEKPQTYTIVDIIPFHKFVDDQVPEQYKEHCINSLLPSYYPILTLKDKVTGLTNNFISPQKISTENDVLIFQPDSDWLKSFFMLYDNAEVKSSQHPAPNGYLQTVG